MSTPPRPRAIVIGGSLGGLFSAVCLRAAGWNVVVFERSPQELDSRGGGLVLQPGVIDALDFAGIDPGADFGVPSRDRVFVDRNGAERRAYMPQTQIAWNGLYLRMRRAVGPATLRAGETFTAFEQDGSRVTARFASGHTEEGDLLIGADGPLSAVRAQLLPGARPTYAGYAAWRGVLPEAALLSVSEQLLRDSFVFQDGRAHQFLSYRIPGEDGSVRPGERRQNWVWYRKIAQGPELDALLHDRVGQRHNYSLPPGAMRDAEIRSLQMSALDVLAPALAGLVTATPDPFLQLIHDYEAPRMVFGRAVLLGDAAFVARPHTGAGAGKAAANAVALARALQGRAVDDGDGAGGIDRALAAWEQDQLPADRRLVKWGIALGQRIMGAAQPA
ncbi:2-polyprenyl-6-methoxyphenol hydroxylase [Ralstonia sp. 25mfcol4.1]|uniref:FAD binding domain-containing protein n=1 Tax=Burkholderiaceae TaxID=119060 RepID=UPI0008856743|nr:FAD-dependent monooxygenase [Ralstonia sp. 25mfcol4.1]SDP06314.1 2-polyprenyl-6-methoxyphenol hydroxylase [Ralstonia sp. 25mfcol4.1]